MATNTRPHTFMLSDYDCVGFDLDNTLCSFKLGEMLRLEYDLLTKYLVQKKGYDLELQSWSFEDSKEFAVRGLIFDIERGNFLRIDPDGRILRAAHGTRAMNLGEIEAEYGKDRRCELTAGFAQNILESYGTGVLSGKLRAFMDFFDCPAGMVSAKIVDILDKKNNGQPLVRYDFWPDVLSGLYDMFLSEQFRSNKGGYFPALKQEPYRFHNRCSNALKDWLKNLKKTKITFLITGSFIDFASHTASLCLGENWQDFFDIIICFARKPGFFTSQRPFIKLEGSEETSPLQGEELDVGNIYSQGNWQDLYGLFSRKTGKERPKCVYFGDNLMQDIFTPSKYTCCDTVAVVEELAAEGMVIEGLSHPDAHALVSTTWGSFFCIPDKEPAEAGKRRKMNTLWGNVINKHCKICIPNMEAIARIPLDHIFFAFSSSNDKSISGFYPSDPAVLHAHQL